MINANFFVRNNFYFGFEIKGHAGYGIHGNDIICAAVSSAVEITINSIKNFIKDDCCVLVDEKDVKINFHIKNKNSNTSALLIKSLYFHLVEISNQYPKNLIVKIVKDI